MAAEMGPYAEFAAAASRVANVQLQRFGMARLRAMHHFIEGFYAGSADEARIRVAAAVEEISQTSAPTTRAMYQIALSQLVPARERELLDQASQIADQQSWTALQGTISHLRIGEVPAPGQAMRAIVQHFRSIRSVSEFRALSLSILSGTVLAEGEPINVSRKVFDLLVALAVRNRPVERDELCEMLRPDDEPQDAANALKMTVRRTRLQCGDPNVVMWNGSRYSLGSHVLVDIREIRAECERAFKRSEELLQNRNRLVAHYVNLAKGCPTHLAEYEWFVGTNASIQNLQIELGSLLARDALSRADYEMVRELVPAMLDCDPRDELVWEISVQAHRANGDFAAARRVFEEYVEIARRSGCRVADHIRELAGRQIA